MIRRNAKLGFVSIVLVSAGFALMPGAGCGSDGDSSGFNAVPDGSSTNGSSGSSSGFGQTDGSIEGGLTYEEVRIDPADAKVDVAIGQTTPPIAYKIFGKRTAQSAEVEIAGSLSFDRIDAANFTGATLTPTGFVGAKGKVTLLNGSEKTEVDLAPSGDKMEAKGSFKIAKGTKGIASVTLAGKGVATARFEVKP